MFHGAVATYWNMVAAMFALMGFVIILTLPFVPLFLLIDNVERHCVIACVNDLPLPFDLCHIILQYSDEGRISHRVEQH